MALMVMTTMAYEHKCLVTNSNLCLSLLLKAQAQVYGQVKCIFKYEREGNVRTKN